MGDIIKKALELISAKDSRAVRAVIIVLAFIFLAISALIAYPSLRDGINALSGDVVNRSGPVLSDVTYDSTNKVVKGNVVGLNDPSEYNVILFILTDQWYVKPDFSSNGLSKLQGDSFIINAFTPDQYENDIAATQYAAFLVPASYGGLTHMNDYDGAMEVCVDSHIDTIR